MRRELPPGIWRSRDLFWGVAGIAVSGVAVAAVIAGPQYLFWPAVGVAIATGFCGLLLVLLGPFARVLAGERAPLTARERKRLSVKDRIDSLSNVRASILQSLTGLVIVAGLIFTGLGLRYTARTLETTQQSQITDRYTKAIDQLGSHTPDIRLGGIYALQRLAIDSPWDQPTIMQVLTAYVHEHAQDPPPATFTPLGLGAPVPLDIDVRAALLVIGARDRRQDRGFQEDLTHADFHHRDLANVNLRDAILQFAILRDANLESADLRDTDLRAANLKEADLFGAYLRDAALIGADLHGADLGSSVLLSADLFETDLRGANLAIADLRGADPTIADLRGANLFGADLRRSGPFWRRPPRGGPARCEARER